MTSTVFYSWQADLPNRTNRGLIEDALDGALKEICSDGSVTVDAVVVRDTQGEPGAPDIAATILARIEQAEAFVCDVSIVTPRRSKRPSPNPNVLLELGYAIKTLGWERLVLVVNTAFGGIEQLPFDLRPKRALSYNLPDKSTGKSVARSLLQSQLAEALRLILQHPRSTSDLAAETEELLGLPPEVVENRATKLLDEGRHVMIGHWIRSYPKALMDTAKRSSTADRDNTEEPSRVSFVQMLDGLTSIGAVTLRHARWDLFDEVQRSLCELCVAAANSKELQTRTRLTSLDSVWVWTEVLVRVYILGALLVHRGRWAQAHTLIQQEASWDRDYSTCYWSRCVMIRACHLDMLDRGWVRRSVDYIRDTTWLAGVSELQDEAGVERLCEFDYLQCIDVALNHPRGTLEACPSFVTYPRVRVEPFIVKLIKPGELRSSLPAMADGQLAKLLADLDKRAEDLLGFARPWFEDWWRDARIRAFLEVNSQRS